MIYDNLGIGENGHLFFAGRDTVRLAETYKTPLYILDEEKIRERCRLYRGAMTAYFGEGSLPLYAGKALCIGGLYRIMKEEGMGIDVVSPGEIYTAKKAGFPMERAFFHGNNKTDEDVAYAMDAGVGYFVCDNEEELSAIDKEAAKRGIVQRVLLRLTPGIDPHTHAKIATGKVDSKFGAAIETGQAMALTRHALAAKNTDLKGFHCHIGSQIFDCRPFTDAARVMLRFIKEAKDVLGYTADMLNLGGGMGVPYTEADPAVDYAENLKKIADAVRRECKKLDIPMPTVLTEPGRSVVADAGITLYTVGGKKEIPGFKNYVSVDGGMADNPRFALYEARYTVITANKASKPADYRCAVAGRCCESGDLIGEDIFLAKPERGDVLAVLTTGAYNYSMSSNYNAICKPAVVIIAKDKEYIAVRRETFEEMTAQQIF